MKTHYLFWRASLTKSLRATIVVVLLSLALGTAEASSQPQFVPNPNAGPGNVIVRGKAGGLIFGFEIDPSSTEGLLCEAVPNSDGTVSAKVETFSQSTGKIIRF